MKTLLLYLFFLTTTDAPDQRLNLAPNSQLKWVGRDIIGSGHKGTIDFIKGWLLLNGENTPLKGEFDVNMTTIKDGDAKNVPGRKDNDLEQHLKNEDFFEVTRFPKAMFQITSAKSLGNNNYTISGFMAIKGIINAISFPATITTNQNGANVKAKFTFNRTKWGINYQSKSIFADLKDGAISDDIEVELDLNFVK